MQDYGPPPLDTKAGPVGGIVVCVLVVLVGAVGIVAYIAVKSLDKFNQSAKVSEAKNTIGAISRQVIAAYEREDHDDVGLEGELATEMHARLCGSAAPVPAEVPRRTKYLAGRTDFETGSATEGWTCLRFSLTSPIRYQYEYRVGGDYKGPKRGGPDPGPNGFEVSAEGDLDGDGRTSLFTLVGEVNKTTRTIRRGEPWSVDQDE